MPFILTAAKHLVDFGSAGALRGNPSLGVSSSKPSGVLSRRSTDVQKGSVDILIRPLLQQTAQGTRSFCWVELSVTLRVDPEVK